jgi:ADP-ribose pyrophosphatase
MNNSKLLLTTDRFRVEEVRQTLAGGGIRKRAIVRHPGAVAIIPLVDADHVCLIRNYRISVEQTLLEIPAGTLEPGEPPSETAQRELREETGYTADKLTPVAAFYLSPGIVDEKMHVFAAEGLTAGEAAREPGEEIENLIVPWQEALQMIVMGRIQDAKTIAALLLYDRLRRGKSIHDRV